MIRFHYLSTLVVMLTLTGCLKVPPKNALIQQEEVSGDVGPLTASQVAKFKYTLPKGKYDIDIWLEQLDADTTEPKRLTFGKSTNDTQCDGGTIWICRSDPATTTSEKRKSWKLVISREQSNDGKSAGDYGSANYLLKNPLMDLPNGEQDGILMSSKLEKQPIKLREEITLMTWAGGPPTKSTSDDVTNFRHVYLKMKIMPHGELFPD